jgi:SnoaL-like domain
MTQATNAAATVDGYFAMWNETDPARRQDVIASTWSAHGAYVDPMFSADGHDGLDRMVAAVHEQYPGHTFRLTGTVDAHHDRARWGWEFVGPDGGQVVAAGVDFARLDADGRLREVTGFIEAAPAA